MHDRRRQVPFDILVKALPWLIVPYVVIGEVRFSAGPPEPLLVGVALVLGPAALIGMTPWRVRRRGRGRRLVAPPAALALLTTAVWVAFAIEGDPERFLLFDFGLGLLLGIMVLAAWVVGPEPARPGGTAFRGSPCRRRSSVSSLRSCRSAWSEERPRWLPRIDNLCLNKRASATYRQSTALSFGSGRHHRRLDQRRPARARRARVLLLA